MSAYQNTARGGDTNFRKTWDTEEYAKLGAEREAREKAESKARYEAKISGKKYKTENIPAANITNVSSLHEDIDDWNANVGQQVLVAPGASLGRRGKGAGKYCAFCDETFKDITSYVDHVNSIPHMKRAGLPIDLPRSTVEECIAYLEMLKDQTKRREDQPAYNLEASLADRRREEEAERAAKALEKFEKRQRMKEDKIKIEPDLNDGHSMEIAQAMGIASFGTTKK